MISPSWYKIFLLTSFVFLSLAGTCQPVQKIEALDSLKKALANATDSLEVARLCQEIYFYSKYEILVQNPDEGANLIRALRIYENNEKWDDVGSIYNSLGGIYYNRNQMPKARNYWNLSKSKYLKTGNRKDQIIVFNNLSCTYFYDSTEFGQNQMKAYLDSAIILGLSIGDSSKLISPYENLGTWYMKELDYSSAEKYTLLSINLSKKSNKLSAIQSSTFQLGIIKKEQGHVHEAINLIEKALTYNAMRNTQPNYLEGLLALSELYSLIGDYKNGYLYRTKYQQQRDTLYQTEQAKTLLNLEIAYETEKRERIILEKDNKLLLLTAENRLRHRMLWVIGTSSFILFGGLLMYRSYKFILKEKSLEEAFSRKLLSSHEEERKRISRDLHDSVGQSLMLIKNKIVLDQDEETVTMVSQALEEVRTISKALHPVLLEKLGLTASIQKLVTDFDENTEILFTEEIDSIDSIFSQDQELHIFRIVQETISNIVKHAKTPSALIKLTNNSNKVTILIKDYGIGFDITDQDRSIKSLGMKTLKERTQILGGKMVIDSVKNQGTSILLEIPKKAK
jgi:signal transduction histidine kinase